MRKQNFSTKEQNITIELSKEQENLLAAVLNLAEMTADVQINEDDRDDARDLIKSVAELFNIANTQIEHEETTNDEGDIVVTIKSHYNAPKPKLTLVSNNDMTLSNDNDNNDWSYQIHRCSH